MYSVLELRAQRQEAIDKLASVPGPPSLAIHYEHLKDEVAAAGEKTNTHPHIASLVFFTALCEGKEKYAIANKKKYFF